MIINKFTGKTEEEAKENAKKTLGANAVIMNVREVRPKGLRGLLAPATYEVTAAIEEDASSRTAAANPIPTNAPVHFDAVVDEPSRQMTEDLKEAFRAVSDVMAIRGLRNPRPKEEETVEEKPAVPTRNSFDSKSADFTPLDEGVSHLRVNGEPTYRKPEMARPIRQPIIPKTENKPAEVIEASPLHIQRERREKPEDAFFDDEPLAGDNHAVVKTLYNVLLNNEVEEKYINQLMLDMERVLSAPHSLDSLLSNVYQKMVLKLEQPKEIEPGVGKTKVVFLVGPTGVGKTTTIAKLISRFKVKQGKSVGLITADTYRMAAAEQLTKYAQILGAPLSVVYTPAELNDAVKKQTRENEGMGLIFVDTLGFSHNNERQKEDLALLLNSLDEAYEKEVYLVLSLATKYKDLINIVDTYSQFTDYSLIFTKMDETSALGNVLNIKLHTGAPLSYITFGQDVPDDIEVVNPQRLVKRMLGGQ